MVILPHVIIFVYTSHVLIVGFYGIWVRKHIMLACFQFPHHCIKWDTLTKSRASCYCFSVLPDTHSQISVCRTVTYITFPLSSNPFFTNFFRSLGKPRLSAVNVPVAYTPSLCNSQKSPTLVKKVVTKEVVVFVYKTSAEVLYHSCSKPSLS